MFGSRKDHQLFTYFQLDENLSNRTCVPVNALSNAVSLIKAFLIRLLRRTRVRNPIILSSIFIRYRVKQMFQVSSIGSSVRSVRRG